MDELYPSEIARLVLGYLKENKCEKSWKIFLEESSNLQEYCELYKKGKCYSTNVNGKSLLDILSEYCNLKNNGNNCSNDFSENTFKERCKVILEEIVKDAVEHVVQKYLPSICYKGHNKDNSLSDVTQAVTSELRADNCIEYGNSTEKTGESNRGNLDNSTGSSSHNYEPNKELDTRDCNIDHSREQSNLLKPAGVSAGSHSLSLIEASTSDSLYLHEIIKVEKENDINSTLENSSEEIMSDICRSQDTNRDGLSNGDSSCNDLHSTKNMSKVVLGSPYIVDSVSGHSENADEIVVSKKVSESTEMVIMKNVKLEPDSEVDCNDNKTVVTNCSQNFASITQQNCSNMVTNCSQNSASITQQDCSNTVEISQTSICSTQNTGDHVDKLGNSISFSNNQSGYALQTTPFSNQPVTANDISFSTVPTYIVPNYASNDPYMQNNAQYSFVINTPTTWKETTVKGFPFTIPSIHSNSLGPVLTSVESIRSNNTPSAPAVCAINAFNSVMTSVKPAASINTSSVPGISVNAISSPVLTTVDTAAVNAQSLNIPVNMPSFVNAARNVHIAPKAKKKLPKSNLVTFANAATKSKLVNKQKAGIH